ncbi:MAG TPA: hypothetical protein VNL35_21610 [Chloroflexota bacterium]|nr:hypothetical protein [Chloroflexota bacterium]
MTSVEADILSTPAILRRVVERVGASRIELGGPMVFLGCGSSNCVGIAMAAPYEAVRGLPAQAMLPSDYAPRRAWTHVAISRTGQTTELLEAMARAREAGTRALLLTGDPGSPAAALASEVLPLEFAAEQGIIQTRFLSAAFLALRLLIGGAGLPPDDLPDRLERALSSFDPGPLLGLARTVFLGRGWRYGLAVGAALHQQETALGVPSAFQTLDYRHGPIACADERTLVWSFDVPRDAASAAVLDDVRATGATVTQMDDDPQVALAQAQILAVRIAQVHGIDTEAPRNLSRAIVLPSSDLIPGALAACRREGREVERRW